MASRGHVLGNTRQSFPPTLNRPVYEESPRALSDIVKPAIMTVLQDPQKQERPQPTERARLTRVHINQHIIH